MTITVITTLPTPPTRNNPATFADQGDLFLGALPTFGAQLNSLGSNVVAIETSINSSVSTAQAAAVTATDKAILTAADRVQTALDVVAANAAAATASALAGSLIGTSTTSQAIASGTKTFTTQTGGLYGVNVWVMITSAANIANWMFAEVTSYSGSTLIVDVKVIGGSGTYADWNISFTGARGPTGPTGATGLGVTPQAVGFTIAGGTTSKTLTVALDANVSGVNTGDQTDIPGNAASLSATLVVAKGGTGLVASGPTGNLLTSNGTTWVSSPTTGISAGKSIALSIVFGF